MTDSIITDATNNLFDMSYIFSGFLDLAKLLLGTIPWEFVIPVVVLLMLVNMAIRRFKSVW